MVKKMWRALVVAVVAIVATGTVTSSAGAKPAAKPPVPFLNLHVLVNKSMGGLVLGATQKSVNSRFPKGGCTVDHGTGSCSYEAPHGAYTVQMSSYTANAHAAPRVVAVFLQSPSLAKAARRLKTNAEIGIGSTRAQVMRAYPRFTCPSQPAACYTTSNGTSTEFDFDKGKVIDIQLSHS